MRPSPTPSLAAAVALLAVACAQPPSAATCGSHADCPSGTTCQLGVCQEGLVLELAAPAAAVTYASGAVPVQVTVVGRQPATVELLVDDVPRATLTPPFAGVLDTTALTEASHTLVASADLGGRNYRSPPRTVVADRTPPAAPTVAGAATNAADPVTVSGTWVADSGAPVTVTVYEGATVKATGVVPSGAAWSAAFPLAEGSHGLTARAIDAAGNASSLSAVGTVVVDRTAPVISARFPAGAATNVWTRDPITVTFSEPMKAATVTDATVALVRSGGSPVGKTASLSGDGLTLTVSPSTLPAVPDTFTLTLNGLADVAGNPLSTATWSWSAPEWQDLGIAATAGNNSNFIAVALAVDAAGLPAISAHWIGQATGGVVKAAAPVAGSVAPAWQSLGVPPFVGNTVSTSIVVGPQGPVVASGTSTTGSDVWAARWDGGAWSGAQQLDVTPASAARTPSVGLDEAGAPYVAWVEAVGTVNRVFVRRWSGATWNQLGTGAISSTTVPAAVPTASAGQARVTWTETDGTGTRVKSNVYAGSSWGASPFSAALTAAQAGGAPLVSNAGTAYVLVMGTGTKVQVYRWELANGLVPAHWQQLTPDLNVATGTASSETMALDPAGEPVVAWYENVPGNPGAFVKRHDATTNWTSLTASPLLGVNEIAIGPTGVVAVARIESSNVPNVVKVWRYNR